jgi:ATP-dependent DNA helicase RecG
LLVKTTVPFNPLLAEPMYLKGYIECLGTGTADMMRLAQLNNLREPIFEQNEDFTITIYRPSTDQVPTKHPPSTHQAPTKYPPSTHQVPTKYPPSSVEVCNLLKVIEGEMSRIKMQDLLELRDKRNFRENCIEPALREGLIRMKYPASPNHPKQRYLLTALGEEVKRQFGNWSDIV